MLKQAADGSWYDDGQPDLSWVDRPLIPDTPPTARITVTKQKPTEWVEGVPENLRSPDTTPFDIAAYRVAKGVKRTPEPVKDDREALKQFFGPNNPERPSYVMEPDLMESQGGMQFPEGLMQRDDGSFYYVDAPSQKVPVVRRPNILPIASTPEGYKFAMPKMLDVVGNVMGGVAGAPVKGAEVLVGSGVVRTMKERPILFYRGQNPGDTRRISTGVDTWDKHLFVSSKEDDAKLYGSEITKYQAKPEAKILYEGSKDFVKIAGKWRKNENMLEFANRAAEAAKTAGYDAIHFKRQGDIGTAIFNPDKFTILYSDTRPQVTNAIGHAVEKQTGPFYSALERTVENAKIGKADAQQWLGYLKNQPGVKQEELAYVLKDLPEGPISKEQLQGLVKQNKVELKEVVKGKGIKGEPLTPDSAGYDPDRIKTNAQTKYHDYQLPGGSNYQEMLLTLPADKVQAYAIKYKDGTQMGSSFSSKAEAEATLKELFPNRKDLEIVPEVPTNDGVRTGTKYNPDTTFKSSHWDEPNILAHVRYNDRDIPDVGKSLHLEEIQSDWHQAGRKQGYKNQSDISKETEALNNSRIEREKAFRDFQSAVKADKPEEEIQKLQTIFDAKKAETDAIQKRIDAINSGVPDAPFKKNWDELALKRMIRKAAEEGYDSISWTPGEAQAARYDLSKQVDKIAVPMVNNDGTRSVRIDAKEGTPFRLMVDKNGIVDSSYSGSQFKGKPLSDVVGKEMADKILKLEQPSEFSGDGLKVGGEGMKSFYDKMLVDKANALAKKYGAKVETKDIKAAPVYETKNPILNKNGEEVISVYKDGVFLADMKKSEATSYIASRKEKDAPTKVHVLKLTPELKKKAMEEGFPLFSSTPILSPVTHNPFDNKEQKKYRLTPVQGNPFQ